MKKTTIVLIFTATLCLFAACGNKGGKMSDYTYRAVPFTQVHFTDDFWSGRLNTVTNVTIPYAFRQSEETGRIANFAIAAGVAEGRHQGWGFNDSDVFKIMEGAAYSLAVKYDEELDRYMDSLIGLIGGAQEEDGYLYTMYTIQDMQGIPKIAERWERIRDSHELYNVGHMYEAAVAHYQATGKRNFLDIAIKNADFLYGTFYVPQRAIIPGHQEIELALVKLYRATDDKRYLDLSQFFMDCRGQNDYYNPYNQDHVPVVEQFEAVGHTVRGIYLYMAMADIAALKQDKAYERASDSLWNDVVSRKYYITGGVGGQRHGEAFGDAYYLPNDSAYCETCAGIANCMWNLRMFQLHGKSQYIDILERTLYNSVLSGISLDGMKFFYPNVLELSPAMYEDWGSERQGWFACACCPSNLVRFIPSLPGYVYAIGNGRLYVNLFGSNEAKIEMEDGGMVDIRQKSGYPWTGNTEIGINPAKESKFDLYVRIPGWAVGHPVPSDLYHYSTEGGGFTLKVNGSDASYEMKDGYAVISRTWKAGDMVSLDLPMEVHTVFVNEKVVCDHNKFSVERGPIVYCAEFADNPEMDVVKAKANPSDKFTAMPSEKFDNVVLIRDVDSGINFIPYYARSHRGLGNMSVFINY